MKKWLVILMVFVAGCSSNTTPQDALFLLPTNVAAPIAPKNAPILIIKTDLAEYLEQVGIVYRVSDTEVVLAKQNRWADKISDQINHRLIDSLRAKQTSYWPIEANSAIKLSNQPQLQISLSKFNGVYTGDAELSGEWSLINAQGVLIKSEYFQIKKALKDDGYDQLVLSLAEGLDDLTTLIAKQINLSSN